MTAPKKKAPAKAPAKKSAPKRVRTPAKPKTKAQRRTAQPGYAAAAVLRGQILELRTLGRTIAQIAEQVNRAPSVVHGHLTKALEELDHEQHEQASRHRALAYNRLERILAKAMLKAAAGDLKAMREATRIIQAQARLMGFEAPIKHASTDPSGEHERAPPGTWTLPMRPDVTIEDWQAQAEAVWAQQQKREAEALS